MKKRNKKPKFCQHDDPSWCTDDCYEEERYVITAKGLIHLCLEEGKSDIYEQLELHALRHGYNAIILNPEGGKFVKVHMEEE